MKANKRDIVEVIFELPDGKIKIHPAIVISGDNYYLAEGCFYAVMVSTKNYHPEFSVELADEMVTRPFPQKSFAKCHLIQSFSDSEIINKRGMVSVECMNEIREKIIAALFE